MPWTCPDSRTAPPDALGLVGRDDQLVAVLARVAGAADNRIDVAQQAAHRQMIILDWFQRLVKERLHRLQRPRPLHGDHGRIDGAVVEVADGRLSVSLKPGQHGGTVGRVTDDGEAVLVVIDEDVVDQPARFVRHQAVLDLVEIELRDMVCRDPLQPVEHSRAVKGEAAHVADVEDSHPLTHCLMFVADRRVLHGHQPAAELNEPPAVGLMPVVKRRLEQRGIGHGAVSRCSTNSAKT